MRPSDSFASLSITERLAARVLGGSVVFFIGAGFSLDSEGNSASRLLGRLLARVVAMSTCLINARAPKSQAPRLLQALGTVFGLVDTGVASGGQPQPALCMTAANVKLLARDYFNFNEWVVSALGVLWREVAGLDGRRAEVTWRIHELENFLLATLGGDSVPLEPVDWDGMGRWFQSDTDRGKALFLDTMGFACQDVMAGSPRALDPDRVADSFRGRLRPRHHVLARLAREGLQPILVTTNYDLLIEGAYRLAGFVDAAGGAASVDDLPATTVPAYFRIAKANQFIGRGDTHRTAQLLKIHGCAETYRDARQASLQTPSGTPNSAWADALPAMVFTYREIQTWRADAWSRDLLRTLLRTHTLALCGYSGADPVMHATFREVYEEMAHLHRDAVDAPRERFSGDAPVFFYDVANKREFHSLEILRAATIASGLPVQALVDHPNQIEFEIGRSGFPRLDDHFRWLMHCLLREVQAKALDGRLRRLAPRLLGRPLPDREHTALCTTFAALRKHEARLLRTAVDTTTQRAAFERIVGWTWHFLPGLLRELAVAEMVEGRRGPGRGMLSGRSHSWYFPATERLEWTAWATLVELGLRNMVAACHGLSPIDPLRPLGWVTPEDSPHAAVSFNRTPDEPAPMALCIRLGGFARPGDAPKLAGAFRSVTLWELREQDIPWPTERNDIDRCPDAPTLWQFAVGETPRADAAHYLGLSDELS